MSEQTIPTSEVLYRAADLIEERGWTQGSTGWTDTGKAGAPLCLEGGIQAALGLKSRSGSGFYVCPAYVAVQDYLSLQRDTLGGTLWWWNDNDDTTAERVIATLRAAAVIEAARENADARESVPA